MDENIKSYVGLDVHKESIAVGVAEAGRSAARLLTEIVHDVAKLLKALARVGSLEALHVVYEAGPTGYALQRALAERGYRCEVIAPSLIPRRPGERIKTDRRDCLRLAELSRAGELRAVWIPDASDEAIRDLTRARGDALKARTQARHQLRAFLLRHAIRHSGKIAWTKAFYRWLGKLNCGEGSSQMAFTEYHLAVQAADARLERLTEALPRRGAGLALRAGGGRPAGLARHRRGLGGGPGGRDRRLLPLRSSAQADGLPRAGALGALQWRSAAPRLDHQDRQRARQAPAHRGGLELPLQPTHRAPSAGASTGLARADPRYRLEGAAASERAPRTSEQARRASQQGVCRGGARAGRVCLGDCTGQLQPQRERSITESQPACSSMW